MKLLAQLMFHQGKLWRERLPDVLEATPFPRLSGGTLVLIASMLLLGILLVFKLLVIGIMITALGSALVVAYSYGLPWLKTKFRDKSAAASVSWAGASIFLLGTPVLAALAVAQGEWPIVAYAIILVATVYPYLLHGLEIRYLALDGRPHAGSSLVAVPNFLTVIKEAYLTLPREILTGPPKEPDA